MSLPIPQPPTIPFIGNVTSIERDVPLRSFQLLAKTYGEIYQLDLLGRNLVCVSSYALTNEVSDDTRFNKRVSGELMEVRNLAGDGLFTAQNDEPNWGIAHRLLMPAFGTIAVKGMMEEMRDISNQLLLKWERFGPEAVINPSEDFTRVALDAIAHCSMSHRLNSFYTEQSREFAVAMGDFLAESGLRAYRPRVLQAVMRGTTAKYELDIKKMRDLADQIVAARKARPILKHDLLDTMLNSRDPKTGQVMTAESIAHNLLTFLIAGHETSSEMMSFMVYFLLKNPKTMRKLRAQVDEVLGGRPVQYDDFAKLPYLIPVMRETLRLVPTAPIRGTSALEDTIIGGGKYAVKKGTVILVQTVDMHRDPAVWGDDAVEFRPERMLDGKFEALPPNAWQPFGFGARALVMASVIQKFDLSFVDPSYTLQIKQTLTIKPTGLYIQATPRAVGVHFYAPPSRRHGVAALVLYGSNTGTSEAFAQRIANEAPAFSPVNRYTGFGVGKGERRATALRQADALLGRVVENRVLTTDGPVKRHIEFELPEGTTARVCHKIRSKTCGVFLHVLVILSCIGPTSLPVGKPVKLAEILAGYIELSQPATTRDLGILAHAASTDSDRSYLAELRSSYSEAVLAKRLSVFEFWRSTLISSYLLERSCKSMRVRQYSISSSPLWNPSHITVTISVLDTPFLSGKTTQSFLGVGSNYLASLLPEDRVQLAVRPSAVGFHPPENPITPVVMFCSGSGIAPMRGFIQERAAQKASGREVGEMMLFFGCRSPQTDFLYSDSDLAEWEKQGVVDVRPAFSRSSEVSQGCKYVQNRVWKDRADILQAFRKGASFFTCGSANFAKGIKSTLVDIIKADENIDDAEATIKFERITKGRYATDIFD
ncbi:cytochrome P450 [Mycena vulgaris]|nr:cytochrome P450 [Mycena vulgaris]